MIVSGYDHERSFEKFQGSHGCAPEGRSVRPHDPPVTNFRPTLPRQLGWSGHPRPEGVSRALCTDRILPVRRGKRTRFRKRSRVVGKSDVGFRGDTCRSEQSLPLSSSRREVLRGTPTGSFSLDGECDWKRVKGSTR